MEERKQCKGSFFFWLRRKCHHIHTLLLLQSPFQSLGSSSNGFLTRGDAGALGEVVVCRNIEEQSWAAFV